MTRPQHHALAGILLIIGAASCFGVMDTTLRYLGAFIGSTLMLWLRFGMHATVMAIWIGLSRDKTFRSANPRFQLLRGGLALMSSAFAFNALRYMPVAEFTAIAMTAPLLITLLARVWLKEQVSTLRWVLVAGGLAGALIIIRPGSGLFGWVVLLPLGCAMSNALFQTLTTRLGPHENPYTTNFYTGLIAMGLVTPVLLAGTQHIGETLSAATPFQLALLLSIGVLGTGGHLLLIMALGKAPTSTLMPFTYGQIAVAAVCGWVAFGASPDAWGWTGIAVIAVCGAAAAWLNVRGAAARQRPVPAVAVDTISE